jgi:S1-C subfamily serine protease
VAQEPQQVAMPAPPPEAPQQIHVTPAVVLATPEALPFAPGSSYTSGSGVVLEGGRLVLTNRHVVEGMGTIFLRNGTGHVRRAHVLKMSHDDDLALLEIEQPFPENAAFAYADLADPAPGRTAVSLGFPLVDLLGDSQPALTEGIVAKTTGLGNDPKTFQITTKINKGNSGGPVFDREGRLLGVTVGQTDAADIYRRDGYLVEDMNIGIKADRILRFLGRPDTSVAATRADLNLEDLYQLMLPRVVLVAAQR